jgi:thiamine biosynthesis lipoprotein ApbE
MGLNCVPWVSVHVAVLTFQELEAERQQRQDIESKVETLKVQVVSIEEAEKTAREQAQAAVMELRQEMEAFRTRKSRPSSKASVAGKGGVSAAKVPALASGDARTSKPVAEGSTTSSRKGQ